MTDPYPAASTTVMPTVDPESASAASAASAPPRVSDRPASSTSGHGLDLPQVTPEKPRTHPLTYLALALSVVALLWLAAISGDDDGGYQKVRVGTEDCVSVPQDNGPAVLYCRK